MNKKCLYCYEPLPESNLFEFHPRCSRRFFNTSTPPAMEYSIDQMAELAKNVVEHSVAVPGVQPKLSLTVINDALQNGQSRLTVVGALGGGYIFKPPSGDFREMPANEHVTMRMAEEVFNLKTVPSSLIRLQSGELAYITRRIDRTPEGDKIHMLDMFQILEAVEKYKGSMEKIGKAITSYSANTFLDLTEFYMLTIFCFLTGNSDMHLKNFSMIKQQEEWVLAPAYDLLNVAIVLPEDTDELALSIEGKKNKLTRKHFILFGGRLGLNERQINTILALIEKRVEAMFAWLNNSFLSNEQQEAYKQIIEKRFKSLRK